MTPIPVSRLSGPALRWAVATALGCEIEQANHLGRYRVIDFYGNLQGSFMADGSPLPGYLKAWAPDEDLAQGVSIIDRFRVEMKPSRDSEEWGARINRHDAWSGGFFFGPFLLSAMRAFVASQIALEVVIPEGIVGIEEELPF